MERLAFPLIVVSQVPLQQLIVKRQVIHLLKYPFISPSKLF